MAAEPAKGVLVEGEWVHCQETIEVVNPYTSAVVGVVGQATPDQAVAAARAVGAYRSSLTGHERGAILERAAVAVASGRDRFAESICAESGSAWKDCQREVDRAVAFLRYCGEESKRITGEAIRTDVTAQSQRRIAVTLPEPVGVVAAITPFNRPLNQVVTKIAPAIAANNRVLLKPSEKTPLTATLLMEQLLNAGLPAGMIAMVTGQPADIVRAVLGSGQVDMLTFTGSSSVGRKLAGDAGMIRVTLELGDSGALIVLADADLDEAVAAAVTGAFATAGQSCRGVKRILVQAQVADAFVERLAAAAAALRVGDPRDPGTDIGTLIDLDAADGVDERVRGAIADGAYLVCGGRREGAQYWPTVLDRTPRDTELVQAETFGPCAPVIRVRDLEDALKCVNDSPYGLQTGVFTSDLASAWRAAAELEVGAVIINGGPQFEAPNIPFGGVKSSGLGREGARYAIAEMTRLKTIVW